MTESFSNLLRRYRGRARLTQRELAAHARVGVRTLQEWEVGLNYPSGERLRGLLGALLEANALSAEHELEDARELWDAVAGAAQRMRAPFDAQWFAQLIAKHSAPSPPSAATAEAESRQDWGEAPDVLGFVGRSEELATLRKWVVDERCRLVTLLGMGGLGKTSLAAKLAKDAASSFECVYWRSVRDAPPVADWLAGAIAFLSDQELVPPEVDWARVTTLMQLLRERRCLVVLDNIDTLLEPGQPEGRYRESLAGYGRVLQTVGESTHQSCLVLTSREAPPELRALAGSAVRTLHLGGISVDEARVIMEPNQLVGTAAQWAELHARYGGNALALKVVSESIRELFDGDIAAFLAEVSEGDVFGGIQRLLAEQLERSSVAEQMVLRALAVEREPVRLETLRASLEPHIGAAAVLQAVDSLRRSSLLERAELPGGVAFTLQSVVLEYVTDSLLEAVTSEIEISEPALVMEQPLIKAQAKDYLRQSQERLIATPMLQRMKARHGERAAEEQLMTLLNGWRGRPDAEQGYGPGNVANLLRLSRGDLRQLDLSQLTIRQAYLAEIEAQNASLAHSRLVDTVLAEAFDFPGSVALSADGAMLAVGTSTGHVWLWRVVDRVPLLAVQGQTGAIWGVALSRNGHLLAAGSTDGVVRLWDTATGQLFARLEGHVGVVRSVGLAADGQLLASGGTDGTVRLWDTSTGRQVAALEGHTGGVWRVVLSADSRVLASVGTDGRVRVWDPRSAGHGTSSRAAVAALPEHAAPARSLALSADGRLLATGGRDGTVLLWDTSSTGRQVASMPVLEGEVWGLGLTADGERLATGGPDGTLRLWETGSGKPVATLPGFSGIWGLALSADGGLLASGGTDGTVRLWETHTRRPVTTLQGHRHSIRSLALSADGQSLASAGADGLVRLWDTGSGRHLGSLRGHVGEIWGVALSADGRLLASGGTDGTVRLWDTATLRPTATLRGHTGGVRSVALSANGRVLASGGADGTVRVWEAETLRPMATLEGHAGEVRGAALSADGHLLASGGADRSVRLWDTRSAQATATLTGHRGEIWALALSNDGSLLASGGVDGTVHVWDTRAERSLASVQSTTGGVMGVALSGDRDHLLAVGGADGTLHVSEIGSGRPPVSMDGHAGGVPGVALSSDGRLLASGSFDGTIRLWESSSGTLLRMLRTERRYEGLDITGVEGITSAQRRALMALGGVDRSDAASPAPTDLRARAR